MVSKQYNVSLEASVVKKAKRIMKRYGGKLSPLVNEFLIRFNEEHSSEIIIKNITKKNKKNKRGKD